MGLKGITINVILVIGLVFALIGLYWLNNLGLAAGLSYIILFVVGLIFIIIVVLAKTVGNQDFWLEIPISKTPERGLLMLMLGIFSLLIIFGISSATQTQFYSPFFMAPLAFEGQLGINANTFSALQAAASPFWAFFISVISAAVIEEIVLGFAFVAMGSLILGYGLRKLLKLDFGEGNHLWDFAMSMIFSVVLFSVLHFFNSTYVNADGTWNIGMFMFAAGFRLVLNIFIYKFGNFGLLFSIGVHAVNNAIFLGVGGVMAALFTFPGGVILDALFFILIFFAFTSIKTMWQEGKLVAKDLVTFD